MTRKAMSRKLQRVVRCLSRDGNVVWVRLAESRARDAHELRFSTELFDIRAPYISHSATQTADHLEEHIAHRALERDSALDSLGHQLPGGHLAFLEIAIGAAVLHRGQAPHAANHLEATALE